MTIALGSRLGPYEIVQAIGAGGMGEVYQALDTRLDRTVAIKVLPEHLSNDATLRERFEREARAVSSLNHPHICTLYDVGEHDEIHYLVMEHIEGETLSDRLKRGALPLDNALEIAGQIADGLAAAYRAGIVHRDLKPGNIMLAKTGVKLLDFGLATHLRQGFGEARKTNDSSSPTEAKPLTDAGTILGTVQYMAPEQLEGKEVDARADLFALGAILFEMVTGRKAFEGESRASLISAIMLTDPPPVSELEALSPPALDEIVKSCLAKDPADRWHSAHDLKTQLGWLASSSATHQEVRPERSYGRWVAVAAALLASAAGAFIVSNNVPSPHVEPLYLDIKLPATDTLSVQTGRPGVTLSPDGSRLAYVASRNDGPAQIFVRPLSGFDSTPIPGTEGALYPFFSPDGESIVFVSRLSIQGVSLKGGAPIHLAPYDGFSFAGGDWLPNGDMVFGAWNYPLRRVSSTDGSLKDFTSLGSARGHAWPDVLPGGKAVLFTVYTGGGMENGSIVVESLETGDRRTLLQGVFGRYVPSGHLIYVRDPNVLSAAPFDLKTLEVTGPGVPVISDVLVRSSWSPDLGFSDRGEVVYVTGLSATRRRLDMAQGGELRTEAYTSVRVSRDGEHLVLALLHSNAEIWIYDLARDTRTRLPVGSDAHAPIWSPDASRVVFTSNRDGKHNLHAIAADGSGDVERLSTSPNQQIPGSISPDGRLLAFSQGRGDMRAWDIYLQPLDGSGVPTPFLATEANEFSPMFSPDGRWLAYVSDESGESAVYIRPFPGPGPRTRISEAGGREPVWAPDGREIHYLAPNGTITSVELHYEPALRAGASRVGHAGGTVSATIEETAYDVMPDGSFVVIREANSGSVDIRFVTNWFEELKRLAPPDN